jgi:serine O-acetyltransferase
LGNLAITATDLAIIYLIPVGFLLAVWLGTSLVVYALVVGPFESPLADDLRRRFERKKRLRSNQALRLSYLYVAKLLLGDNCVQATFFYRLSRFFVRRGLRPVAEGLHGFSKLVTHVDISPHAEIGPGFYLYHGLGTVIGKGTRVGRGVLICQNVTTGGAPRIGDEVILWAGAKVIGKITVGDRAEIGANAVVIRDIPPDSLAVGVPANRVIPRSPEDLAIANSSRVPD